jgi:hypothetical protein
MRQTTLPSSVAALLSETLTTGDLVKFAKQRLTPADHHRCLLLAMEFVRQTAVSESSIPVQA